jgi:parallel beta-helix repeat protein
MKRSFRHNILLYSFFALTLSLALALPTQVRADETPPPVDTPAESTPADGTPSTAEPPAESNPAVEAAPDLTGTVTLLNQTDSVLTDENGDPIPLASQEAVEMLSDPDPYIVRGATTYAFTKTDCDPLTPGDQGCDSPVQAAINFAAPGETVNVDPGTYTEQLTINKDLTLLGTAPGVVFQSPAILANCYTTSNVNNPIICVVGADNVSISNLTIDGAGLGNANYRFQGIGYYNAGGTIDGNTVLNIEDTPFSGAQHGAAIYAYNLDGTPRTLTVTNNTIEDFQKAGIVLNGDNLTVLVDGNTVVGAGPTAVTAQNGIQIGYGATGTVSNNSVSDVDYTPATWTASGILLYDPGDGVVVTGNEVQDAQSGIYAYSADDAAIRDNSVDGSSWGITVDTSDNVAVTGNTVTHSDGDGIDLYSATNVRVKKNTVDHSSYDGIWLGGASSEVSITGNTITHNGNGVSDPSAAGIHVADDTDPDSLTISGNVFEGNRNGVSNSLSSGIVAAYNDYWGCQHGPFNPACDPVYGLVYFNPFLSRDPRLPVPPAQAQVHPPVIPVTGGQAFDLPLDTPVVIADFMGVQEVQFQNLSGYSVVINESPEETLPDPLQSGESYAAGLSITVSQDGQAVDVLPQGSSVVVRLKMPKTDTSYRMLYWDPQANNNLGAWYSLPPKQADISQPIPLHPGNAADQRKVIVGTWVRTGSDYLEAEVNFTGTFVLVTP